MAGTPKPNERGKDPTIAPDLNHTRLNRRESNCGGSPVPTGMIYHQGLSSLVSVGVGYDAHHYQSLLEGKGHILFAHHQLMVDEETAKILKVNQGLELAHGTGYVGSGFKFSEEKDEVRRAVRKAQAKEYGFEEDKSDSEDEDEGV